MALNTSEEFVWQYCYVEEYHSHNQDIGTRTLVTSPSVRKKSGTQSINHDAKLRQTSEERNHFEHSKETQDGI